MTAVRLDWPPEPIERGMRLMEFGPQATNTELRFPRYVFGEYLPYYPGVLVIWLPDNGQMAIVSIPDGAVPVTLMAPTPSDFSTVKNKVGCINIYKDGTDLIFQFKQTVQNLNAIRIL